MKNLIVFLFIMVQSLYANTYPYLYSNFGTPLLKAVKTFNTFDEVKTQSKHYEELATEVLNEGLHLSSSTAVTKEQRLEYLQSLRKLEKAYNQIIASLNANLLLAIERDDHKLFQRIINSGLSGIAQKDEIVRQAIVYYDKHKTTIKCAFLDQKKIELEQKRVSREQEEQLNLKKELEKNRVSFLRIAIQTTDTKDAGTSQLLITFTINEQSHKPIVIFSSRNEEIKRGSAHILEDIKVPIQPEDINSITLKVDGYNAWHIQKISFQLRRNNRYSREYKFNVNQWFSSEPHDLKKLQGCSTKRTFSFTPSF